MVATSVGITARVLQELTLRSTDRALEIGTGSGYMTALLAALAGHDGNLKDASSADSEQPQYARNADRAVRNEFLVVEGTCTHLGCLPKARFEKAMPGLGADWPGGFLCPCHGSRFDLAGVGVPQPRLAEEVEPDVGQRDVLLQHRAMAHPLAEALRQDQVAVREPQQIVE
jgi:Rieske Fe-S protein